jgi:hypothetical protein
VARQLVAELASRQPDLLVCDGIDLGPAIEQVFFGRMRRPRAQPRMPALRSAVRALYHGALALRPTESPRPGDIIALVVNPAHARILEPVSRALDERGVRTFTVYESHARATGGAAERSCRLVDRLTPRHTADLLAFELHARRALKDATREFGEIVGGVAAGRLRTALSEAIGRLALYATCINELADRGPSVLVGFNEIGRWSRILPAVGRRAGVPTLDVAHAEAADADAIEGASYDRFAVFGPRSQRVLEQAGIDASAIVQVGAPRFDALIARHRDAAAPRHRRLVFASQWITGPMTEEAKAMTVRAALAAAAAAAPCELVIQRHPIERDDIAARVAAAEPADGVLLRAGEPGDLYAALDGAWLLVTGWSNAVFEAVLSNVPALCINATGGPAPMPFVEDGIALGATDPETAAAAARTLLPTSAWLNAVGRARTNLADHLGPLDGRATERLVELILSMRAVR